MKIDQRIVRFCLVVALGAVPVAASAQTPAPVTQSATATVTATITAIDYTSRTVVVQFADKTSQTVQVGKDVTRFPQLKVGDVLTFTETESLIYSIAKPGATAPPDAVAAATASGAKPNGAAMMTQTAIVTVTALDPSIPSITIKTADGHISSYKVQDPKNIVGVKVGDRIQITHNVSLMISVK